MATGTDRAAFYAGGRQSVRDLEAALASVGRRLDSFSSVLDFGCGCGRILLWLEHLSRTAEVHGCDVDARAVRWAADAFPWAKLVVNQPEPPLPYADGTFDLVYNHSVFTHLDEEHQDLWLAELRRVTRPGGLLLLTVHGEKPLTDFEVGSRGAGGEPDYVRAEVRRRGISFVAQDSHVGSSHGTSYHSTFHAPWYVLDHWSQWLDVRAYILRGSLGFQDMIVLERRPDDAPAPIGTRPLPEAAAAAHPSGAASLPAVDAAVRHPLAGPDVAGPGRYGQVTTVVRKAVGRAIAQFADYQRGVDEDVQRALLALDNSLAEVRAELERLRSAERVHGVLTLNESNVRLWDALQRQGERVNRLEEDLWAALEAARQAPATGRNGRRQSAGGGDGDA
ncbi:MAG TPA: class I SAM-dependent methyltransferase [Acidimicrobiales bacterium]|nr:class I SAM-dependent methyltransferase [Acidimicrobiales bacterium]